MFGILFLGVDVGTGNEVVDVIVRELCKVVYICDDDIFRFEDGTIAIDCNNIVVYFYDDVIFVAVGVKLTSQPFCLDAHEERLFNYVDWVKFVEYVGYTVSNG